MFIILILGSLLFAFTFVSIYKVIVIMATGVVVTVLALSITNNVRYSDNNKITCPMNNIM